jgi:DNA primase
MCESNNAGRSSVRRAALALSRAIEGVHRLCASSKWWKEERHGVFLDYNQVAKDRTTCSAYSVRPPTAVCHAALLAWSRLRPGRLHRATVPKRFAEFGDPHLGIDAAPGSLEKL